MFDPELRLALGYFYAEFLGIHQNYVRRLEFIESVIIPTSKGGPSAFYDSSGRLQPEFQVQMSLLAEFGADIRRVAAEASRLEKWLRSGHPPE
jgi:hypothetical protein